MLFLKHLFPDIIQVKTVAVLCVVLILSIGTAKADDATRSFFDPLLDRLVADGFNEKRLKEIYQSDQVFFETRGVTQYFIHNEAKLDYNKLTRNSLIQDARAYMSTHKESLNRAQSEFQVDPRAITAIILVETNFGRTLGNKSILNTFSTMAVLTDSAPREYIWEQLPEERRFERNRYDQKADSKADWAYKELKAFLTYTELHKMDPTKITGSYAGALGISQFIPSNIIPFGQDGDGDGRINLFEDADAILSIASYLKQHGWKPNPTRNEAFKVIYTYNHSKYYVNTILKIMDLLEDKK